MTHVRPLFGANLRALVSIPFVEEWNAVRDLLARLSNDGSRSMSRVLSYRALSTGADDGQRFAALMTASSALRC